MAAFDFPSSPNNGDTYSANGIDWIYNGSVWKKDATAGVKGQKGEIGVGDKGQKGQKGEKGEIGDKGQKGEIGATGGTGGVGTKGQKGEVGAEGSAADKGQKGEIGPAGGTGGAGQKGEPGGQGVQGNVGQKGEPGAQGAGSESFASGTRMIFQQTSAPTGWTKITSGVDNRALRLVSGTTGASGSNGFTNVFNSTITTGNGSVSNHTLSQAQMPTHFHNVWTRNESAIDGSRGTSNVNTADHHWTNGSGYRQAHRGGTYYAPTSNNQGSSNSHNHGFTNPNFNLNVAYTDVIVAQKN